MRGSSHHEYSVLDRGAACLQCKKRKKRCDGVKPVCGPCIRIGTAEQCEFPQPPPPKVKKPKTPPRSKNETLRAQIRLLEDKIARLQSAISSTSHTGSTTNYVDDSSSPSVRGSSVGLQDEMLIDEDQTRRISKISQIPDIPPLAISFSAPSPSSPDTASSPSSKLFQGDFPLPTWTEEIFDVFMRYRHRCGYEIDEQRFSLAFRTSLRANRHRHAQGLRHGHDTSDSESDLDGRRQVKPEELLPAEKTHAGVTGGRLLHPALMNAVLLLGCHFATSNGSASGSGDTILDPSRVSAPSQHYTSRSRDPSQSYYSPTLADTQRLLHYTRLALENALNSADRLHDFLHATFLLVFFYFATGRVSEAQYHSAGLAGFVGACKLNELDVSDQTLHGSEARMLIDSPRDQVDIEERIGLFWNVFILDKYAALVYGSMSTLRDERIWTPWPRSSEEWSIPRHSEFSPSSAWNSTLPALNHLTLSKVELTFRSISIYLLEGVMRLDKSSSVSSRPFGELRTEADLAELTRNYESLRDTAQRIAVWLPDLDLTFIQRDLVSAVASAPALHSRHYYGHQSQSSFSGSMGRASTIGLETNMLDLQTSHMPSPPSSASALYTGGYSTSGSSPLSSTYAFFPSSSASSPALPAPITVFGSGLSPTGLTSNPTPSPMQRSSSAQPFGSRSSVGPGPTQLRTECQQGSDSPPQMTRQSRPSPPSSSFSASHPTGQQIPFSTVSSESPRKIRTHAALLFAHCVVKAAWIHLNSANAALFGVVTENDGSSLGEGTQSYQPPVMPHDYLHHQQAGEPRVGQHQQQQHAAASSLLLGQHGHIPQGAFQQHVVTETGGLDQSRFHAQSHQSHTTRGAHQQYHDLAGGAGSNIPDYGFGSSSAAHGGVVPPGGYAAAPIPASVPFAPSPAPSSSEHSYHSYSSQSPASNPSTYYTAHSSSPLNPHAASNVPMQVNPSTVYPLPPQGGSFYHSQRPPTPDPTIGPTVTSPPWSPPPPLEGSMGNIGDDSWSGYIHSAALASSGNDDDHTFSVLRGTPLPSANNLHSTLSAAKAISELAGVALSHSEVFEELDMMIGLPWVTACQVLSREIQTQSEKSMGSIQSTFLPQPQAFGQHTPSFAQDASFHTTTAFQPHPHIELLHQQQYQGSVPLSQPPQPSSSSSSFVSSPPLPTVDQNSPGYPISPESLSYTQHSYSTSLLEQNAFSGLKTSGPAYREAEVEKVNATLNALKEQKDVLLRALDRLGNTYEIVRMMRSAM